MSLVLAFAALASARLAAAVIISFIDLLLVFPGALAGEVGMCAREARWEELENSASGLLWLSVWDLPARRMAAPPI
jgi:hypothetical protein